MFRSFRAGRRGRPGGAAALHAPTGHGIWQVVLRRERQSGDAPSGKPETRLTNSEGVARGPRAFGSGGGRGRRQDSGVRRLESGVRRDGGIQNTEFRIQEERHATRIRRTVAEAPYGGRNKHRILLRPAERAGLRRTGIERPIPPTGGKHRSENGNDGTAVLSTKSAKGGEREEDAGALPEPATAVLQGPLQGAGAYSKMQWPIRTRASSLDTRHSTLSCDCRGPQRRGLAMNGGRMGSG